MPEKEKTQKDSVLRSDKFFFYCFITGYCGPARSGLTSFGHDFCLQETNKQQALLQKQK